jgi:formate-dependent phosphoribosylglycinamide formyltransferase (GAR transformylase)
MSEAASISATPILWGTPHQSKATRLLLLGSGELGREVAIEAMRLGIEVIAVDSYVLPAKVKAPYAQKNKLALAGTMPKQVGAPKASG